MSLDDTIRAGQAAALEQIKSEGKAAIQAAETEYSNRLQELKNKLSVYIDIISKIAAAINDLKQRLKMAQDVLATANRALHQAQAELAACKRGSASESAAASKVAKCNADVQHWEAVCKKLFSALQIYEERKRDMEKTRDDLVLLIRKLESDAQNVRGARDRFQEEQIHAAAQHVRMYPGGR